MSVAEITKDLGNITCDFRTIIAFQYIPCNMKNLITIHSKAYQALIDWLVCQRNKKGITTQHLADTVGLERSIVSKIETYVRRLDVAEYIRFCKALDVDPSEGIRVFEENS